MHHGMCADNSCSRIIDVHLGQMETQLTESARDVCDGVGD
jgi:hypothetical protein